MSSLYRALNGRRRLLHPVQWHTNSSDTVTVLEPRDDDDDDVDDWLEER